VGPGLKGLKDAAFLEKKTTIAFDE